MKKFLLWFAAFLSLCGIVEILCGKEQKTQGSEDLLIPKIVNKINWVEVSQKPYSTRIMFDFSQPVFFKKKLEKDLFMLKLSFPGMQLENFNKQHVLSQFKKLQDCGLIDKIEIVEKHKTINKVNVLIQFARKQLTKNSDDSEKTNRFLIVWSKLEDPNRLILDIFTKENLDILKQNDSIILQANYQPQSFMPDTSNSQNLQTATLDYPRQHRIIVDPGHGGKDAGAEGFGMQEKHLTLDVAKIISSQLKENGHNVMLTRNQDQELSLLERSELAAQLKANLFVSIHVNSAGTPHTPACGIETFYLNPQPYVSDSKKGGCVFVNLEKNLELVHLADQYLKNNATASKKLAACIQSSVVNLLKDQGIDINNRGIKPGIFRVLLQNTAPSALVEVGFITNKEEAYKLSKFNYRQLLAQGICDGIKKYICLKN